MRVCSTEDIPKHLSISAILNEIMEPLTKVFNLSVSTDIIPQWCKIKTSGVFFLMPQFD